MAFHFQSGPFPPAIWRPSSGSSDEFFRNVGAAFAIADRLKSRAIPV
jgi:hypothetical protein